MLKIGDFSKISRVSIRMLRHYDEIDLLKPIQIDPFTGYRYYSEEQLLVVGRILALKNMGFRLSTIGEIMDAFANTVYKGSYEQISDAYGAVVSWLNGNGYEMAGPMFNIYHVTPAQTENPEEYVTEVCCPVKKK